MPVASFRVSSSVKLHLKLRQLQHQRSALSFLEDKLNTPSSKNNTSSQEIYPAFPSPDTNPRWPLPHQASLDRRGRCTSTGIQLKRALAALQHGKAESHPEPGLSPPAGLCSEGEFHLFPGFELQLGHTAKCILIFCLVSTVSSVGFLEEEKVRLIIGLMSGQVPSGTRNASYDTVFCCTT